jgi:hypothetical protein
MALGPLAAAGREAFACLGVGVGASVGVAVLEAGTSTGASTGNSGVGELRPI